MERKVYLMYRIANNPAWYMTACGSIQGALNAVKVIEGMWVEDWKIVQEVTFEGCEGQNK